MPGFVILSVSCPTSKESKAPKADHDNCRHTADESSVKRQCPEGLDGEWGANQQKRYVRLSI